MPSVRKVAPAVPCPNDLLSCKVFRLYTLVQLALTVSPDKLPGVICSVNCQQISLNPRNFTKNIVSFL